MILRLLTLVMLLISTSSHNFGRDVEFRDDVANSQETVLQDYETDSDYINDYNWAVILCEDEEPVLEADSRPRATLHLFDRSNWLSVTSFINVQCRPICRRFATV